MSQVNVFLEICREGIELPTYTKEGDAGMDVRAAEDITIYPSQTVIVPTGLKFAIPIGYEIQVRPRSGISFKTPLRVANAPGTVDSGYRDELGIIISNTTPHTQENYETYNLETKGNKQGIYKINKGDRIAQIVLKEVPKISFTVVEDVSTIGTNRNGGFGSSGIN